MQKYAIKGIICMCFYTVYSKSTVYKHEGKSQGFGLGSYPIYIYISPSFLRKSEGEIVLILVFL